MINYYVINNNQTTNPGLHHEVHTLEHASALRITSATPLGYFINEIDAVQKGKLYYSDADGCAICCFAAHKG